MNIFVFFTILSSLAIISIYISCNIAPSIKTNTDYFLSGRKLNFIPLTLTFLATQLGGGALIGSAESAYKFGWVAIYYSLGLALGLVILSLGVGSKFRSLNVKTIPELFLKVYHSENLQYFASILSIFSLFFILIAIGVSARKFFTFIGYGNNFIFFGFWLIVILYTVIGGLSAVVKTDIIQIGFILLTFIFTSIFLYCYPPVSFNEIEISKSYSNQIPWNSWLLMPLLFVIIGQDMGQRCFAAKSPRTVSFSTIFAAFFLIACSALPIYLGIVAANIGLSNEENNSILMQTIEMFTTPTITSFFACALLMAILSTADSLLCSISSNLALDFPFIKKMSSQKGTKTSKIITFVVGMLAMFCSYFKGDIIPLMVFAYELSVSALFVPVIMSVLIKSPSKKAAGATIFVGITSFLIFRFINITIPKEILSLSLSFVTFFIVNFLLDKRSA